jgi:YbbR domain-containing protein
VRAIWPFQHLGLKALALVLALLLWLVVSGEEVVERGLRVPLELQQFPAGLELRGEWPTFVDVRLRGPSTSLGRMAAGDIVAVLDLKSAKVGPRLFQLTPDQVRTPFGVEVVQVNPSSVALTFEKSKARWVPIRPPIDGEPAPGFVVGKIDVNPATVEVVGPETVVDRAIEAFTEPVSVAGARDQVVDQVTVGFLDAELRLKVPRPAIVTVQVLPGPAERTLGDRAIHLRNLGPNLLAQAIPPVTSVVLRGTRQGLARIDTSSVSAYVDLTALGPGEHVLNVQVDALHDAGISRIDPDTIRVRISSAQR